MECSVEGCSKKHYGLGFCGKHYKRFKKTGSTESPVLGRSIEDRYEDFVVRGNGCWGWTGGKTSFGYGVIRESGTNGKLIGAHRASFQIHIGPIPDGKHVLHRCDNPACTNPDHLFIGTHQENMDDMVEKGRSLIGSEKRKGELSGRAKLTNAQVVEIKRKILQGLSDQEISEGYPVTKAQINYIRHGKSRKVV